MSMRPTVHDGDRVQWMRINDTPGPIYDACHRASKNLGGCFSGKFNHAEPMSFIDQIKSRAGQVPGPNTISSIRIQKHVSFTPKPMNGMDAVDLRFRMKEGHKPGSLPVLWRDLAVEQQHTNTRQHDALSRAAKIKRHMAKQRKIQRQRKQHQEEEERQRSRRVQINSLEDTFSIAQEQLDVFMPTERKYDRYGREVKPKIQRSRRQLHEPFTNSITTLNHYRGLY